MNATTHSISELKIDGVVFASTGGPSFERVMRHANGKLYSVRGSVMRGDKSYSAASLIKANGDNGKWVYLRTDKLFSDIAHDQRNDRT